MPVLRILVKRMANRIRIAKMNRLYRILQQQKQSPHQIEFLNKHPTAWKKKKHKRLQLYLILRIKIAYKESIPSIEDEVRALGIIIRRRQRIGRSARGKRVAATDPATAGGNRLAGPSVPTSNKAEGAAAVSTPKQPRSRKPDSAGGAADAGGRRRRRRERRRLLLQMRNRNLNQQKKMKKKKADTELPK